MGAAARPVGGRDERGGRGSARAVARGARADGRGGGGGGRRGGRLLAHVPLRRVQPLLRGGSRGGDAALLLPRRDRAGDAGGAAVARGDGPHRRDQGTARAAQPHPALPPTPCLTLTLTLTQGAAQEAQGLERLAARHGGGAAPPPACPHLATGPLLAARLPSLLPPPRLAPPP